MDYRHVFQKIREHADAGLDGSPDYARDRLRLIRNMAALATATMDNESDAPAQGNG